MSLNSINDQISRLTAARDQIQKAHRVKAPRPLFSIQIGGTRANTPIDDPLLHTIVDPSGRLILMIPVVINDHVFPGKPYTRNVWQNGSPAYSPLGTPVTETIIPQLVGSTRITSSIIPFADGTITGFAQIQVSALSPSEILDRDARPIAGATCSLDHIRSVTGLDAVSGSLTLRLDNSVARAVAHDDTDSISTCGDFDPSSPPIPHFDS